MTLQQRLTLLIAATIGPLAIYQAYELVHEREQRIASAIERVQESARTGAARFSDAIDDARSTLNLLSRVPDAVANDTAGCHQFFNGVLHDRPWADALFLIDVTGRIACSTVEGAVGLDVSQRAWYLKTIASGRFTVSDFYITLLRKRPTVAAALALASPTLDERAPVLMANLDLKWFDGLAKELGTKNNATVLLVDGRGRGLSRYPAIADLAGKDLSDVDAVKASLTNESGLFEGKGIGGELRYFGYLRLPGTDARLMVSLDRNEVLAPIDAAVLRAILLFLGIITITGSAIWLAGKRIFVEPLMEAGRALRKSETFLRGVVNGSGDCIKVIDLQGKLEFISHNGQCLMEIDDPASVLGKPFEALWPEVMRADILAKLVTAWAGEAVRFDAEIQSAKGRPLHVDVLITAIRNGSGEPERLVAMARDVTDLKKAEYTAREAEVLFRGLFDHATDLLFVHQIAPDGTFYIETCNPRAAEVMDLSPEHIRGRQLEDVFGAETVRGVCADLQRTVSQGTPRRFEISGTVASDDRIWEVIHVPLRDEEATGRINRVFASARDVTHLRHVERAVRDSEARYRLLADHSSDLIVLGMADGRHTYISPAVTAMLGYTVEEALRIGMRDWVHPDDLAQVFTTTRGLSASAPTGSITYRLRRKDGSYLWVEAAFRYVDAGADGIQIITAIRDVSERQRYARDLQTAKEAAELAKAHADAANVAKTDFLATMSHEIRTPLNAIIGFTGLIIDQSAELPPAIRRHAELVQSSGSALLTVVNDILDFSKVEAGAIELEARPFALSAVVDNCISMTRGAVHNKALEIKFSLDTKLPHALIGDEARLRQILLNLLNNALKFTHEGYVALSVRHEGSSAQGERIRIAVSDTGIGIPKEKQARLFQRFSQADGSIKRDFGGTGLGLAICKSLVALMGGEIGVFSDEGKGATFWFTVVLPRGRLDKEWMPATTNASMEPRRSGYLLLVEDVEVNQTLARLVLEAAGHTVDVVSDGAAAVLAVQDHVYDLVLMDVQMPGMDGMSATQIIRRTAKPSPRLPIIAMTANVLPDQIRRFREAGMDDHVGKPFNRAELYATIDRWLPQLEAPVPSRPAQVEAWDGLPFDNLVALLGQDVVQGLLREFDADLQVRFAADHTTHAGREQLRRDALTIGSSAAMLGFVGLAQACGNLHACQDAASGSEEGAAFAASLTHVQRRRAEDLSVLLAWRADGWVGWIEPHHSHSSTPHLTSHHEVRISS